MVEIVDLFNSEIQQVCNFPTRLDAISIYVAGAFMSKQQGDLSLEVVLGFLEDVEKSASEGRITLDQRLIIGFSIYQGRLEEAMNLLYEDFSLNSFAGFLLNSRESDLIAQQPVEESKHRVDEDAKLAREMALQYESELQVKDVNCQICLEPIPPCDFMPLELCGDLFHLQCISQYIKTQIDQRQYPINCPIPECSKEILMVDIAHRTSLEDRVKYDTYSLNRFVELNSDSMSCCPTPDCKYVFSFTKEFFHLNCPLCRHQYCMKCKCDYHHGKTCKEYLREKSESSMDKAFYEFVQGAKYKMCSRCNHWIEKSQGCNHMTCRCGYQFCYVCGGPYKKCRCVNP